ncbi:MAG: adenylate/guanylate cyclase domain-containing protein [Alphaproteobacteria bacterium]|nr:adenylate/guanylate cyclase domain-containing protein [Alphaproteobacteria bacterium]
MMRTLDAPLDRRVSRLHRWAVDEGLRGETAHDLFAGFCQHLLAEGFPLWRGYAALETLHPRWWGSGFTWQRGLAFVKLAQFGHDHATTASWVGGVFHHLAERAKAGEGNPCIRRQLAKGPPERDFPALERFHAAGATDYLAELFDHRRKGTCGLGVAYSFMTDRPGGFSDSDVHLLRAALPAVSLAMKAHAGQANASRLLQVYLGEDAGRRVHGGEVERGSVESLRAVLWYADIRGFTAIADDAPAHAVVDLLDDVFETLAGVLREYGGQVLKFIGDGLLATFSFDEESCQATCRRVLDAAAKAMDAIDTLNAARRSAGKLTAAVDLALHVGDVLFGNVGAVDRLDFTMIGPAVNEVSRIEALCARLGHRTLISAELAAAAQPGPGRLMSVGYHDLRGVRAEREIYALRF